MSVFLTEQQWTESRRRRDLADFAPAVSRLRADVDDFLARPLAVPTQPGGYYHDYFCPDHGVELVFDPGAPTRHRCPVDDAVHRGERLDAAWRWFANDRLARAGLNLATLWRLTGDEALRSQAAAILTGYADQYPIYQTVVRTTPNPGVATYTTLDESVWLIPLTWAFDALRESLSAGEIHAIEEQLLLPAADHLVRHHFGGIHNFACWHNAAIGTVGLATRRPLLVDFAVEGPHGFHAQMETGVLSDGLWFEGSFSYHFYTLAALLALAKASFHRADLALHRHPALPGMFDAPMRSAYPDGTLPATNDCWYFTGLIDQCCHGVPPAPAFYELAYAWYGDPRYGQVLQRAYRHGPRDSLDALLFGRESLPQQGPGLLDSEHLAGSGYAILRTPPGDVGEGDSPPRDSEDQRYLLLKYGPHGGGHGHPDKLNLILYACGRRLSPDLGTPGYGLALFERWYRQTISHNTVTLDGLSQPPAAGTIHRFQTDGPYAVADAEVRWPPEDDLPRPYRGVVLRRVILSRPAYFLDLFLVSRAEAGRVDWIYRNVGAATTTLPLQPAGPALLGGEGYSLLEGVRAGAGEGPVAVSWREDDIGLDLHVAGASNMEILLGSVPANPPTERHTTLIVRRQARHTAFFSLFHPYRRSPRVQSVTWRGGDLWGEGWVGCEVALPGGQERWLVRLREDVPVPFDVHSGASGADFDYCLDLVDR